MGKSRKYRKEEVGTNNKGRAQENPRAMDKTHTHAAMSRTMPAPHPQTSGGTQNIGQGNEPAVRLTRSMPSKITSGEMVTIAVTLPSQFKTDVHFWLKLLQEIQQHMSKSNKKVRKKLGHTIQSIISICEAFDNTLPNTRRTYSSSRKNPEGILEWETIQTSAEAYQSNVMTTVNLRVEPQCLDKASEQEHVFKQICEQLQISRSKKKTASKVNLSIYAPSILFFIRAVAGVHQPGDDFIDTGSSQSLSKPTPRGKVKVGQAPTPASSTGSASRDYSAESGTSNSRADVNNEGKTSRRSMKNLEEREVSLQRQANKINQQQQDLDNRERDVSNREAQVRTAELDYDKRAYKVKEREDNVIDRDRKVGDRERKVENRERDIQQQEAQLNRKQNKESNQGGNKALEKKHRDDMDRLNMELQKLRVLNEDLRHRLSKEMGDKVAANESSVENISIKHRPMTITDAYTHFQSEEWLEVKECLDEHWSKSTEADRLQLLSNILKDTEFTVKEALFQLSENLNRALLQPAKYAVRYMSPYRADHSDRSEQRAKDAESFTRFSHATGSGRSTTLFEGRKRSTISHGIENREVPIAITNAIGDFLRVHVENGDYKTLIELATTEIIKKHPQVKQFTPFKPMQSYIQATVLLCWKMAIQRPPMTFHFTTNRLGDKLQELHWGSNDVKGADVIVVYPLLKHGEKYVAKGKIYLYTPERKRGTKL